jgi:hypothetical protein
MRQRVDQHGDRWDQDCPSRKRDMRPSHRVRTPVAECNRYRSRDQRKDMSPHLLVLLRFVFRSILLLYD